LLLIINVLFLLFDVTEYISIICGLFISLIIIILLLSLLFLP